MTEQRVRAPGTARPSALTQRMVDALAASVDLSIPEEHLGVVALIAGSLARPMLPIEETTRPAAVFDPGWV